MDLRHALLRTLAFFHVIGHAPTRMEWKMTCDVGHSTFQNLPTCGRDPDPLAQHRGININAKLNFEIDDVIRQGTVIEKFGRCAFDIETIQRIREQEAFMPRKRRVARATARWIASFSSVRFVALCNSAALGHSSDASDVDFFVITRAGTVAATRLAAALPYKISGRRPGSAANGRDAICLSYFISDAALDVRTHLLAPDDPYFRFWFLSLLPMYDDGISHEFWDANTAITSRHPFARRWQSSPDLIVEPRIRIPVPAACESMATRLQHRAFPPSIRGQMNRDTRVIVTPDVLKFHVNDRRDLFRRQYMEECKKRGLLL